MVRAFELLAWGLFFGLARVALFVVAFILRRCTVGALVAVVFLLGFCVGVGASLGGEGLGVLRSAGGDGACLLLEKLNFFFKFVDSVVKGVRIGEEFACEAKLDFAVD